MEKNLNDDYQQLLDEMVPYIHKIAKDENRVQILKDKIIEQLTEHQNKYNNTSKISSNIKDYVYKTHKNTSYKNQLKQIKEEDKQKYSIATIIIIMCGYIVIVFLKEFLSQNYLIHFYVDSLIAVVAFYITIRQMFGVYHLIKKQDISFRPFIIMIVGFILSIIVTVLTYTSPFDITFLLIVIASITSKRIYDKEMAN
ncbi:MAG: hypothetical protein LUF02_08595 [Erysipelotrichaceae bacterium]|nr:hypothetical protein [Erysipelotrichaceae bacterium]